MNSSSRVLACAALLGAPYGAAHAQTSSSAPIRNVAYVITADSATVGGQSLGVAMTFDVATTRPVILALPAWSPGHYTLLWFARRLSNLRITQSDSAVEWRMRDFQTWEIHPRRTGPVRVEFRYRADAIDRAVAWTRPDFAFFNGTNVFMYPVGQPFSWPAQVTIRTESSWRIATSMDVAGPRAFRSSNYHDLVDRPFFVGRFDVDSARVSDRWIRFATYPAGAVTGDRRTRLWNWVQKFVPQQVAVFGEAPFKSYTIFQVSDSVVNDGGLEHQDSQMDEVPTQALDGVGPGLYSHEFFHAWNVKRLRPADLVPYRYDDAQPSRWLWVSEGVTDYYGQLTLVRAGIIREASFQSAMAANAASVLGAPRVSVADASLQPWINPTDGTGGIYYPKGAAIGFLLDILIRDASDNRHSLDDVMRGLYETTWKRDRGFTPSEWWAAVRHAANGKSFTDFAARYVDGREPLPFDAVLRIAGLAIAVDTLREPRLGVGTATVAGGVTITSVVPAGAAAAGGLQVGDQLVSLGDVAIRDEASFDDFRARYAGTAMLALPVVVSRGGRAVTVEVPVRLTSRVAIRIAKQPDASAKAAALYRGLIAPRDVGLPK